MYSDLFNQVITSSERDAIVSEVEVMKNALFSSKAGGLENVLKTEVRASTALAMRQKLSGGQSTDAYLENVLKELKSKAEVKLTLAFEPTESFEEALCSWFGANIGGGLVLDIKVDPSVIGGALVSYKGKYFDGSLSKLVGEIFKLNETSINKILTSSKS